MPNIFELLKLLIELKNKFRFEGLVRPGFCLFRKINLIMGFN